LKKLGSTIYLIVLNADAALMFALAIFHSFNFTGMQKVKLLPKPNPKKLPIQQEKEMNLDLQD